MQEVQEEEGAGEVHRKCGVEVIHTTLFKKKKRLKTILRRDAAVTFRDINSRQCSFTYKRVHERN